MDDAIDQIVLRPWNEEQRAVDEVQANSIWLNPLIFPAYATCASALLLFVHILCTPENDLAKETVTESPVYTESGVDVLKNFRSKVKRHFKKTGGLTILTYRIARLLASSALTAIFALSFGFVEEDDVSNLDGYIPFPITFLYATFLSLMTIIPQRRFVRNSAAKHLVLVLLIPWAVLVYRDIIPLLTFTMVPLDDTEEGLLWVKIGVLTLAAVIIPLFIPPEYFPDIDEEFSNWQLKNEDSVSWASRLFFIYCDPLILKAAKAKKLESDDLAPMLRVDRTKNLVKLYPHIDPLIVGKKRHIANILFFSIFPWQVLKMSITLVLKVAASFAAPIGLNRLLNHLERGGEGAIVRPWVWILWLLAGPMLAAVTIERFHYLYSEVYVQTQSLLTQLIFDHALRIRMKAEVDENPKHTLSEDSNQTSATVAPDNASVTGDSAHHDDSTVAPSTNENEDSVEGISASASPTKKKGTDIKDATKNDMKDDAKASNTLGKINNLVTSDLSAVFAGQPFLILVVQIPIQVAASMIVLYTILGWSIIPGLIAMIVMMPIPGYLSKLMNRIQEAKMKKSDSRVQIVSETMNVIRMVKLFGWENKMGDRMAEVREDELKYVRQYKILSVWINNLSRLIPISCMVVTYTTYTLIMKEDLTPSKVFPSIAIFAMVQDMFSVIIWWVPYLIQAKVSLSRINDFLHETELLDGLSYPEVARESAESLHPIVTTEDTDDIGIQETAFRWETDSTKGASDRRGFTLRIEDKVFFQPGKINLVIGQTGSGKTSLLMALLGEMHAAPLGPNPKICLPRHKGIAYHAQESWVLNGTIRNNIIFGANFDEERYNAVLTQCSLNHDLRLFDAGDQTEVGEKGITLSGGQKARITLARAVYSNAETLLLDDVLAALDVHTAKWIIDKCLQGDLVRGRTVILVTHNIALAAPIADFVVSIGLDGRILSQGSLSSALSKDAKLSDEVKKEAKAIEMADHQIDENTQDEPKKMADGKLVVAEELEVGHVSWDAMKLLLGNMASPSGLFVFYLVFFGFTALSQLSDTLETWTLGVWTEQYQNRPSYEVSVPLYLGTYVGFVVLTIVMFFVAYTVYTFGSIRASASIHRILLTSVFRATFRWLDSTPVSRIITRCTADISAIDQNIPMMFYAWVEVSSVMIARYVAILLVSPAFSIPGMAFAAAGAWVGNMYMKGQLPVTRESNNAKAPIIGHLGALSSGVVSIRAYGAQDLFRRESYRKIDRYTRASKQVYNLNRWITIRTEGLGGFFTAGLAAYLVYGGDTNMKASLMGFSLTMAVGFTSQILWWVRSFNAFQTSGTSLERVKQYLTIEHEPSPKPDGIPPAYWPASGDIIVNNLSARYSADGPKVLNDISFHIKSGERVGIVGRTGSGKSSLTLALMRCILTEGSMYYDGIETHSLNIDALRSQITIIPQVPELLSGTLRENLDPFSQHDDVVLNDALRSAGLFSLQAETDENRITLDTMISGGGSNLSVGQRQILALARALVRRGKVLILDEATSAIDYDTDKVIQNSLRRELNNDVTVLTIAHRLQTIMDADKIIVLEAGEIVEFDSPSALLQIENGNLRRLVEESSDKELLMEMAGLR
ncbi:hypothetical protein C8Q75DRAFT_558190 [Abortiporus biennis]|nr:hypothetical protein C8Q75DRAFT_558190 [Abortiporus biennis]